MSEPLKLNATEIENRFKVADGLYVVGIFEKGVTVYNQQVRAHNLVWSMSENCKKGAGFSELAIIGGGVAGLTVAACCLAMFPNVNVTIFERQWELCSMQLGSDNRWLHPRIYDWPEPGCRAPSAALPILNWNEGRASDVARQIISKFSKIANRTGKLSMYLGTRHLRIDYKNREIEWLGNKTHLKDGFLDYEAPSGQTSKFDRIVLTTGFGMEKQSTESEAGSYWQNDRLGQPLFDGKRHTYLISGYGDGALIDLCRLRISRFRQDSILYELLNQGIDEKEDEIDIVRKDVINNPTKTFSILENAFAVSFQFVTTAIAQRLRNDTRVVMHLAGHNPDKPNSSIADVLAGNASFLNKFLFFALFKAGGFSPAFGTLADSVDEYGVVPNKVLIRHGTSPRDNISSLFKDASFDPELIYQHARGNVQSSERCWSPGSFPMPEAG